MIVFGVKETVHVLNYTHIQPASQPMDRDILNEPHTKEFNCVKGLNQFLDWAWG